MNISRCVELFPLNQIVLITDQNCQVKELKNLELYRYTESVAWHVLNKSLSHPKEFRQNFWFTSVARFLAIESYMKENPEELIHVESDVILAGDFPFASFSKLKCDLAFPLVSPSQGIASVLYLNSYLAAQKLARFSLEQVRKDSRTTDMIILRNFCDEFPKLVRVLPIGPITANCYRNFIEDDLLLQMSSSLEILGGIIDGADLGYYIYGIDPRNSRGVKILRKGIETNYLDVSKTDLMYSQSRNFLNVWDARTKTLIPVFSLHIHSKNSKLFHISRSLNSLESGIKDYSKSESFEFVPSIFLFALFVALKRRLVLGYKRIEKWL